MQTLKQYPYLVAVFALFFIMLILFSLSYCGGQTDAKYDNSVVISKDQFKYFQSLEKRIKESQERTLKAIDKANGFQQDLELKQYRYDSLRKVKPKVIYRDLNVGDDSLTSIWASQIR